MSEQPTVSIAAHPLVSHHLTILRDAATGPAEFRRAVDDLTTLVAVEATRNVRVRPVDVQTPVAMAHGEVVQEPGPVIVPILRAGLGMLDSMQRLMPMAQVGFLGMMRDELTLEPSIYADRLPIDLTGRQVFVIDPMLATGGSLIATIDEVLRRGAADVTAICLLASPEGVERVREGLRAAPIRLFVAAIDERLNDKGFIVPGLGDAGDRLYGVVHHPI